MAVVIDPPGPFFTSAVVERMERFLGETTHVVTITKGSRYEITGSWVEPDPATEQPITRHFSGTGKRLADAMSAFLCDAGFGPESSATSTETERR